MVTLEEFAGLIFILSIGAIFFYFLGRLSVIYKNNKEIKLMTDKVNCTLEKYSDKNPKKKNCLCCNMKQNVLKKILIA